ncbi:MAG: type I-E CRISPR-associated protein Cse1/CasA [Pseudomonadota bacterium]
MNVHAERRFNLVDEGWIPVAEKGLVSLKRVFTDSDLSALGGNPVEKIALIKLFLAIAQATYTPSDETEWASIGWNGLSKKVSDYLTDKKDLFWLYGDKPFLQMPTIAKADIQTFSAVLPNIATGNTTLLLQSQIEKPLNDSEKALLLVFLSGFALGGKQTDNSVVLTPGYSLKTKAGKPGPSLGFLGYLHSFLTGRSLIETVWLNWMTHEQLEQLSLFPGGIGTPPWEKMPEGEACIVATNLTQSLMGRLLPLCRFALLAEDGLHYSEGILHPTHKNGGFDPSITVDFSNDPKAVWVDPEKRPWRQLTSLLSFFNSESEQTFDCYQIHSGVLRARKTMPGFCIWSGGLRVKFNSGEQGVKGNDDFVESETYLSSDWIGEAWFTRLKSEMTTLDEMSKTIFSAVSGYCQSQKMDKKTKIAKSAMTQSLFWQMCEKKFQELVYACGDDQGEKASALRPFFTGYADTVYNRFCPKETARQIECWAKHRPNLGRFLK